MDHERDNTASFESPPNLLLSPIMNAAFNSKQYIRIVLLLFASSLLHDISIPNIFKIQYLRVRSHLYLKPDLYHFIYL